MTGTVSGETLNPTHSLTLCQDQEFLVRHQNQMFQCINVTH